MRTSLLLIFTSIFMGAIGQILLKTGMSKIGYISIKYSDIIQYAQKAFVSPYILVGILSYMLSMILWLIILSRVELSFAYPMVSAGYIIIIVFSYFILHENISLLRLIGVIMVCMGILFIARS
jgi:multidrug transporter EmrE-like cation transporter